VVCLVGGQVSMLARVTNYPDLKDDIMTLHYETDDIFYYKRLEGESCAYITDEQSEALRSAPSISL
jgi:hypothetical protein